MNTCINCGNEFNAERSTAKFCNDKCRKYYSRKKLSRTNNKVSVTKCPANSLSGTDSEPTSEEYVIKHSKSWQDHIDKINAMPASEAKNKSLKIIADFAENDRKYKDSLDNPKRRRSTLGPQKGPYKVWITDPKKCKEDPYKVWHPDFDYDQANDNTVGNNINNKPNKK